MDASTLDRGSGETDHTGSRATFRCHLCHTVLRTVQVPSLRSSLWHLKEGPLLRAALLLGRGRRRLQSTAALRVTGRPSFQ